MLQQQEDCKVQGNFVYKYLVLRSLYYCIVLTTVTASGDPLAKGGLRKVLQWRFIHHSEHVQEARRRCKIRAERHGRVHDFL